MLLDALSFAALFRCCCDGVPCWISPCTRRRYENFAFAQPYQHCMFHESLTLEAVRFDYPSRIAALKPLTVADLAAFVPGVCSSSCLSLFMIKPSV